MQEHVYLPPAVSYNRLFLIAFVSNAIFVSVEFWLSILANSESLMADALHNLGDITSLLLAWYANWLLTHTPKDSRYSYGYKKISIITAVINALLLVALAGVITYEAITKLFHPSSIHIPMVLIGALGGIIVNLITAMFFHRGRSSDLNIKGAYLHLLYDAVISLGVLIGAIGMYFTHWLWIDAVVGCIIVVILIASMWRFLRDSFDLLLGAAPKHISMDDVQNYLLQLPSVIGVHDLHIWGLSTREVAMTAHLVVKEESLIRQKLNQIQDEIYKQFHIEHMTIQIETEHPSLHCRQVLCSL